MAVTETGRPKGRHTEEGRPGRTRVTATPEVLTVSQVATILATSNDSIERWIHRGDLEAVRLPSGRLRIPIAALHRLQRTGATQ